MVVLRVRYSAIVEIHLAVILRLRKASVNIPVLTMRLSTVGVL